MLSKISILPLLLLSLLACRPAAIPAPAPTSTATAPAVAQVGTVSAVDFCSRRVIGTLTPSTTPTLTQTPSATITPSRTSNAAQQTAIPSNTPGAAPRQFATATYTPRPPSPTVTQRPFALPTQPPPTGTPGTTLAMYTAVFNAHFDIARPQPGVPLYISPVFSGQDHIPVPAEAMRLLCIYIDGLGYAVLPEEPGTGTVLQLGSIESREVNGQQLPTISITTIQQSTVPRGHSTNGIFYALTYTPQGWKAEQYMMSAGIG